jgi:hypothetical protein
VKVTITDVTSLGGGKVCLAGLAGKHSIRLNTPTPREDWIGQFKISPGSILDISWKPRDAPEAPHLEDGDWEAKSASVVGRLTTSELVKLLSDEAFKSVRAAFGEPWFVGKNGNCAFRPRRGTRSLATVLVERVNADVSFGKPKVSFLDASDEWTEVPLQDLTVRRHLRDCKACQRRGPELLQEDFSGKPAILRIGLAREWQAGNYEPACWLQVNQIFVKPYNKTHFV